MRLSDYINESIISVIKAINEINAQPYQGKAHYPQQIEFTIFVDNQGNISESPCDTKINMVIPIMRYIK